MRGIELAQHQPVAHIGPRHFAHQLEPQPLFRREAAIGRHDQGGGVDQRDEAGPQRCQLAVHFSISAAVTMDWAISASFFCSFIAARRIRS